MRKILAALALMALASFLPLSHASAQGVTRLCVTTNATGGCQDVSTANPLPTTGGGGGGGGAITGPLGTKTLAQSVAMTIADCNDVTQGCEADAAWVSGSGTVISLLKKIAGAGSGSNASVGTIGATAPTSATYFGMLVAGNLVGVPGTANGLKTDGSGVTQPGSAASGAFVDGAIATLGAEADAACSTDIATCTAEALYKRINQRLTSLIAAVNSAALTPPLAVAFSTNNANTTPHVCGSHIYKHITTATDTQIVAASGSTTIYICDYSFSFNGTGNAFLEKATSGTCATLTQIDQTWYGAANLGKLAANPYYQGLNTGASAQLCVNTSAGVSFDIAVNYDQY